MIENPNASNRAYDGEVITPSDTVKNQYDALYIGTSGNLNIRFPGKSTTVLFTAVPVGFFPVAVDYVMATSTGASTIVGLKIFDRP